MGGQGFNSYLLFSEEGTQMGTEASSWGVDSGLFETGLYFNSESMSPVLEQKFLTEIGRSGTQDRAVKRHRILGKKCEGSVEFTVYPEGGGDKGGIGLLIKHLMGAVSSGTYSGEGTFLHTFTPQDNLFVNMASGTGLAAGTGKVFGLTTHVGREDDPGTIRDYPFLGCRIRSLTFSCATGEELKCTVDMVGRVAKHHVASKSVSYPSMAPFTFKDATFQMGVNEAGAGGTTRYPENFSLTISNNFKEVFTLGTEVLGRCIPNGQRVVTGSITVPYEGWTRTEVANWLNGASSSMNVAFDTGDGYRLEFRLSKIFYTGNAPNVDDMEENVIELPFQAVLNTNFDVRIFLSNRDRQVGFVIAN